LTKLPALTPNLSGRKTLTRTIYFRSLAPLLVREQSDPVIHGSGTNSSGYCAFINSSHNSDSDWMWSASPSNSPDSSSSST
jgi:hypothetical protein